MTAMTRERLQGQHHLWRRGSKRRRCRCRGHASGRLLQATLDVQAGHSLPAADDGRININGVVLDPGAIDSCTSATGNCQAQARAPRDARARPGPSQVILHGSGRRGFYSWSSPPPALGLRTVAAPAKSRRPDGSRLPPRASMAKPPMPKGPDVLVLRNPILLGSLLCGPGQANGRPTRFILRLF